jgi:HNH endonuclease
VNPRLVQEVWKRAGQRCEYCLIPFPHYRLPFQIDHIVARQHHGATEIDNLALACFHCNRHKGPNIAGRDPVSGEIVRLFHPRTDVWSEHFQVEGAVQIGLTPIGRATVEVLAINASDFRQVRETLISEGVFPGASGPLE